MFWPLLMSVFVGLVASLWLRWRYRHRRMLKMAAEVPGPPALPGVGNAVQFMCSPEELIVVIRSLIDKYGDVVKFWLGPDLNIVVSNPEDLKVLLPNPKVSMKGPQYKYMADVLGGGILSGSGPTWRKHRKIATPNYGKRAIESYSDVFNEEVTLLLKQFRGLPSDTVVDLHSCIVRTTSYSVCQTLMGLTKKQTLNLPYIQQIIDETPRLYDIVFERMTKWYLQIDPIFWITRLYREQRQFIHMITEFSKEIIKHRLEYIGTLEDTCKSNLMSVSEDSVYNTKLSVIDRFILSSELEKDELLKETFTIFTSSQEASAKISSFLLMMMAYHPQCQERLYKEIRSVMGDDDRPVTDQDLKQMTYLDMVFREVLRLYPIGAILQRTVTEDVVISSAILPAGSSLVVPVYHIHRDPRFWANPDAFDPERFSTERVRMRDPYCYIPFSLGPMDCLGRYFGTKLIKTICVRVLREFEVTSINSYKDLRLAIAISAASLDGYGVKVKRRI